MSVRLAVGLAVLAAAVAASGLVSRSEAASPRAVGAITLLRVGTTNLDQNVDPAQYFNDGETSLIFEYLVTFDATGRLVPELAQSVARRGPAVYVFHLHHGVKFSDGTPLTSADVVNALRYYRAPKSYTATAYASVKSITARDKYTVVAALKQPDASFEQVLAWEGAIFEKKFQQAHRTSFGKPGVGVIGSGPWVMDSLDPATGMELSANPHWWGGKVNIEHISIKSFADETSMALAFRAGAIDVAFPHYADPFVKTSGAKLQSVPAFSVAYLGLNTKLKPLSDIHVRRAIAYAIDKPLLIKANGNPGVVINDFIPPAQLRLLGSASKVNAVLKALPRYPYNLAKAKAELAKSAYPHGFSSITIAAATFPSSVPVVQALTGMLQKIGVKLTVKVEDANAWIVQLYESPKRAGNVYTTFNLPSPDPSSYPSWMLGSKNIPQGGWNWANYDPAAMDTLIGQGTALLDPAKRLAVYAKLLNMVATDVPYIPLFIDEYNVAVNPKLVYTNFNQDFLRTRWALNVRAR
jgi:peptide/nickel transport system substrate-binding protein